MGTVNEQILDELEELRNEVESLIEKISEGEESEPTFGDAFWFVDPLNKVIFSPIGCNVNTFENFAATGNVYFTKEEAEQVALNRQIHEDVRKLAGDQSWIDWEDEKQSKYCVLWDNIGKQVNWNFVNSSRFPFYFFSDCLGAIDARSTLVEKYGVEAMKNYLTNPRR